MRWHRSGYPEGVVVSSLLPCKYRDGIVQRRWRWIVKVSPLHRAVYHEDLRCEELLASHAIPFILNLDLGWKRVAGVICRLFESRGKSPGAHCRQQKGVVRWLNVCAEVPILEVFANQDCTTLRGSAGNNEINRWKIWNTAKMPVSFKISRDFYISSW